MCRTNTQTGNSRYSGRPSGMLPGKCPPHRAQNRSGAVPSAEPAAHTAEPGHRMLLASQPAPRGSAPSLEREPAAAPARDLVRPLPVMPYLPKIVQVFWPAMALLRLLDPVL